MHFLAPDVLWWLLAIPLLAAAGGWSARRRRRIVEAFAGGPEYADRFTGQVSAHRRAIKLLLLACVAGASIVALARPQWGARLEPIRREGVDVMIVLDTSLSMATEDIAPSRLGQARHEIGTLIERLAGNRIGLVTFAGEATLTCPLTPDHEAIRLFLDTLDVEAVPVPGTALASALELAARALGGATPDADGRGRAIVVFSDGEDHEGELDRVLPQLQRRGVTVFAVGCGTTRGAPIPLRDAAGMIAGYKKDGDDKIVTSRLVETELTRLALETGGRYYRTTPVESEVDEIAESLVEMDAGEFGALLRPRYEERFQIPLALAWLALLAETLLGDRRRSRPRAAGAPAARVREDAA